jgi:hypothetical protein
MPINKSEVIKALNDPALGRVNFSVGLIKVNAAEFRKVADCISTGDITVTSGNEALAFYSPHLNELTTQQGNPPLDSSDRAQLLHECTHAIVDINEWNVLRLHDEAAGYLTQFTYLTVADNRPPLPLMPPVLPPGVGSPQQRMFWTLKKIVLQYGLHETRGFGAAIKPDDIALLVEAIHAHPDYAGVKADETRPGADRGVPGKHLELERQRAMMSGKQDKMIILTDAKTGRSAVKPLNRTRRRPSQMIGRRH